MAKGGDASGVGPSRPPLTPLERHTLARRRRLQDDPRRRWLWAVAAGFPVLGLPVLVAHARSRRTLAPALHGLAALAAVMFAVLTLAGFPVVTAAGGGAQPVRGHPALLLLVCWSSFAFGHKLGQERARRDALRWLELEL